jgi:asparagine synthetase B (glutamine-hydrolysing)
MCGIYCALSRHGHVLTTPEPLLAKLQSRGPDSFRQHVVRLSPTLCLIFAASVLSLRGDRVVAQPLVDVATGSVLCWNGEAWAINGARVEGNDSEAVFRLLLEGAGRRGVLDAFSSIRGPFSCVYYDGRRRELFFGRDVLGRRSMVKTVTPSGDVILCSVPRPETNAVWTEVEADGMYVVSLSDGADHVAVRCPISYQADSEPSEDCIVSLVAALQPF